MANAYYNFDGGPFIPGTRVRSNDVNVEYEAIVSAFDNLPLESDSITGGRSTFAGVTAGTGNAYTVAMPNTRTVNKDGDEIVFIADRTNTGAATLNVDGIGAVNIVKVDGTPVAAGDLEIDLIYAVRYDETNLRFQMMLQTVDAAAEAAAAAASATAAAASALEAYHWAQYPEDSLVPEGDLATEYSAYHWNKKAEAWAASVNLPNITGNALKVLRANAGETGLEYWNILGTNNDWSLLQTVGGGIQVYGTIAGALHSGLGLEIETVTKPIIRGYDRSIPGYANILYDASQHEFYTSGTRTMAISTDYVTLGTAGAGTSPTIVLNSGVGGYPSFEWLEFGDRKAQMYHNSGSNEFLIRKYLDSNPATVVGQIVFADSGSITLRDEVNSKVLTAANGEFIANGGDYFAREARANVFTQPQYINSGGASLLIKPGASDHCYISWYPDTADPNTRWAYTGFGATGSSVFYHALEQAGGRFVHQVASGGDHTFQINAVDHLKLYYDGTVAVAELTGTANTRVAVNAAAGGNSNVWLMEGGLQRGILYYDASANKLVLSKYLESAPGTPANYLQLIDDGHWSINDNVTSNYLGTQTTGSVETLRSVHPLFWVYHTSAILGFDTDVAGDSLPIKRITCNDGYGNWNFRHGCYNTGSVLGYTTTGSGAAYLTMTVESQRGYISMAVAPTGTADAAVSFPTNMYLDATAGIGLSGGSGYTLTLPYVNTTPPSYGSLYFGNVWDSGGSYWGLSHTGGGATTNYMIMASSTTTLVSTASASGTVYLRAGKNGSGKSQLQVTTSGYNWNSAEQGHYSVRINNGTKLSGPAAVTTSKIATGVYSITHNFNRTYANAYATAEAGAAVFCTIAQVNANVLYVYVWAWNGTTFVATDSYSVNVLVEQSY